MEILAITDDYIDDCIAIYMQAYNTPPWNYNWTIDKARQYLSEYRSTPYFVGFVLYDDGDAIGAVFAHKKTWWTNNQLFVDEFFVTPAKQRMGYGKKLMDHCALYTKQNQLDMLVLMTNKYMPSFKFYNKIDYTTTEQFVFMFKQTS